MAYFVIVFLGILLAVIQGTALATENTLELEDVVVTASRVSEELKGTPNAVNIITEQELEGLVPRNPDDYLSRIPGVYSHNLGGESEITSIRVPTHFTNPYTLVLIDGVPASGYGEGSSGQIREFTSSSFSRVEVLKGPASAIYGSNAIGGTINVITRNPPAAPEIKIWSDYGEYSQWRSGIAGGGTWGNLGFLADAGYIEMSGAREHNSLDKKSGLLKSTYSPTDNDLVTLKVDFLSMENESAGSLQAADFETAWQRSYHKFTYNNTDKITPHVAYTHYFDAAEFTANLVYREMDEDVLPNYGRYRAGPNIFGSRSYDETKDIDLLFLYSHDLSSWKSKIIGGLDTEHGSLDSISERLKFTRDAWNNYTSYTFQSISGSYDITTDVVAPYLQYEFTPVEKLKLTAGGRYDTVTYEVDDRLGTSKGGTIDFSQFSPKVGLTYDISTQVNTYLSYSEGFVVPTTSQLWTSTYANKSLDPEKAKNYEAGVRTKFFNKRLAVDCSVYSMDITDKVVTNAGNLYVNAGETSLQGIETTAIVAPVDIARLTFIYTYADNKYETYSSGSSVYSGNRLPRSPEHRINTSVLVLPGEGLEIELEMDIISRQYADDANIYEYSRPALFNIRTSYDLGEDWSFWAHLKNVADKEYATYISSSTLDGFTLFPGEPRTIFAGLSYTFGGGEK